LTEPHEALPPLDFAEVIALIAFGTGTRAERFKQLAAFARKRDRAGQPA
jgi:hypothetical protein